MRHYAAIDASAVPAPGSSATSGATRRRGGCLSPPRLVPPSEPLSQPRRDRDLAECSVRCTGQRSAISSRRARCSASSGPSSRCIRRVMWSIWPSRVSQSAQSAAWILSWVEPHLDVLERPALAVGVEARASSTCRRRARRAAGRRGRARVGAAVGDRLVGDEVVAWRRRPGGAAGAFLGRQHDPPPARPCARRIAAAAPPARRRSAPPRRR